MNTYCSHLSNEQEKYALFYAELVQKVAEVAAQWMASGFCHAVLNTDNMSITGESFDYGPYAFIPNLDRQFTAAYFDHSGRYSYGNQPGICKLNLELLQRPLAAAIRTNDMGTALSKFEDFYDAEYRRFMLRKLGFEELDNSVDNPELAELLRATLRFLNSYPVSYHHFFSDIATTFSSKWRDDASCILSDSEIGQSLGTSDLFVNWSGIYHRILSNLSPDEIEKISLTLNKYNPKTVILRPVIESVWENIASLDNWIPFYDLVKEIQGV
ncbi:hypothetical protein CK510_22060 [Brunnivagina elsteri CCALA 953]|uniref:Selenoprotein O n=1 Tax=Brunnivagina elsteri CCALA 953 TaxID=987040 RepID=A0A2A2TDQ5_9CYAN|nr:hypothetical protein CK510_22060 [Calothrix elsteri CCALA 953]